MKYYKMTMKEAKDPVIYYYKWNGSECIPIGAINDDRAMTYLKPSDLPSLKGVIGYNFKEITEQEAFIELI